MKTGYAGRRLGWHRHARKALATPGTPAGSSRSASSSRAAPRLFFRQRERPIHTSGDGASDSPMDAVTPISILATEQPKTGIAIIETII